jgi:hypothetical protein
LIRPNTYGEPVALWGVPRLAPEPELAFDAEVVPELEGAALPPALDELEELLPQPATASAAAPRIAAAANGLRSGLMP